MHYFVGIFGQSVLLDWKRGYERQVQLPAAGEIWRERLRLALFEEVPKDTLTPLELEALKKSCR